MFGSIYLESKDDIRVNFIKEPARGDRIEISFYPNKDTAIHDLSMLITLEQAEKLFQELKKKLELQDVSAAS